MTKQTFNLIDEQRRNRALDAVRAALLGKVVIIQDATRSTDQNSKLHAVITDVANQLEYMGKKRTLQQWKILLISGHAIATENEAEVLPGIENEFVTFRESSAQMSKKRLASVIEYIHAYGSEKGVRWSGSAREAIEQ